MANSIGQSFLESSPTPLGLNATYIPQATPPALTSALTSASAYGESELGFPQVLAGSFLVGESYNLPTSSNMDPFTSYSGALGDQMALRNRARRQTVSSRGPNSPRGRPRGLDGVDRRFSLRESHSRSRSRRQTASENGDLHLRDHEMGHSTVGFDREPAYMDNISNISFQVPVAGVLEQAAMLHLSGSHFPQSFEMGTPLQAFQGPNMFQDEVSTPGRSGGQLQSFMLPENYPLQTSIPSNVSWNQELDQNSFFLSPTFGNSYGNPQSHLIREDIQSYQGDFGLQPFTSSEQFTPRPPFRANRDETHAGLNLHLDIPTASSQYLSNEECSSKFHSRSTSIQTPIITINGLDVEGADSALNLLPVQTEIKSFPLQPRMASLPHSYLSTSLSSSGANESLRTPVDVPNFFSFGSIDDATGGMGSNKHFMNNDYDNVSNISEFGELNMHEDMQP